MKHSTSITLCLILISAMVLVSGCTTVTTNAIRANCPNGDPNPNKPIVCVDVSDLNNLKVYPDPVRLKRGKTINWITNDNDADLTILFDSSNALIDVKCKPRIGSCVAKADSVATFGNHDYSVIVSVGKKLYFLDPRVIIEP